MFVLLAYYLAIPGCVVTDKIEFKDAVNMPFEIIDYTPPNDETIHAYPGYDFSDCSVTVWDPDVEDLDNPDLRGKLLIHSDYWISPVSKRCSAPSDADSESEEVHFNIECSYRVPEQDNLIDRDLTVELVVSDRGFDRDGNPREGARVKSITWTIRVEEE